jgi:hypothetical protein
MDYQVWTFHKGEWQLIFETGNKGEAKVFAKRAKQENAVRKIYVMQVLYEQVLIGK